MPQHRAIPAPLPVWPSAEMCSKSFLCFFHESQALVSLIMKQRQTQHEQHYIDYKLSIYIYKYMIIFDCWPQKSISIMLQQVETTLD